MVEPPFLAAAVAEGRLPPVAERIPARPAVVALEANGKRPGRYGGTLRILGGSPKDTRTLVVYGYARLVGYDENFNILPDIVESVDVVEGRSFTFHLRPGHRWSDGAPFTAEDFRYYWEDVGNDPEVSRFGPPKLLLVDGEKPRVEFPDPVTVRYSWSKPNPYFLPALAAAQPLDIFRPAHYLKQFHARHAGLEAVEKLAKEAASATGWRSTTTRTGPTGTTTSTSDPAALGLEDGAALGPLPLRPQSLLPRVDAAGHQLPYIDQVALSISNAQLVAAKAASGETDLQGAYLGFSTTRF
jgi:peptide/nickel transport system substrate-binding protein